jgi:hypothetical protein
MTLNQPLSLPNPFSPWSYPTITCYTRGMTNDKIRALISRWRQRVEAQEHALEAVDRMEEVGVETFLLLTQAHQNELERCIMELEQLFD